MDQTEHFVESKPKIDHLEEQTPEIVESQIEDVVIPAENLIIFQEQKADEEESVEALNVAVVLEGAPGDLTSTDFITQ